MKKTSIALAVLLSLILFSSFGCLDFLKGGNGNGTGNNTAPANQSNTTNNGGANGGVNNQTNGSGSGTTNPPPQINETENRTVEKDTTPPKVRGIELSDYFITQSDWGTTLTVIVHYDESMLASSAPTIISNPLLADMFIFQNGSWTDNRTYRANYLVKDLVKDVRGIAVYVIGARDDAGNMQEDYRQENVLNIDTAPPIVTGIALSKDYLFHSDLNGEFWMDIDYNETMLGNSTPTVAFTPDISELVTLENGSWTDPFTYRAYFRLGTTQMLVHRIRIGIIGAQDAVGNPQVPYAIDNALDLDTYSDSGGSRRPN